MARALQARRQARRRAQVVPAGMARLLANSQGVTVMEFALIAPAFLTLIFGTLDLGQMAYGKSVLSGAVQKAACDSALETVGTQAADDIVKERVRPVFPGATFSSTRTSYADFVDVSRPEKWNDGDNDGACNHSEAYVDENGDGDWDSDIGKSGNGGANDVVLYRFTVSYKPVFAIPFMPQQWQTRSVTATAIRKNQPFASQMGYSAKSGVCS